MATPYNKLAHIQTGVMQARNGRKSSVVNDTEVGKVPFQGDKDCQ